MELYLKIIAHLYTDTHMRAPPHTHMHIIDY